MSKQKGDESAFGVAAGSASVFVVADWVKDIIEGPQGMNSFQRHEMVIWNEPERIAAANWVLRCLANPRCEGSDQMLHAILERRKNAMRSQNKPSGEPPTGRL